MEDGCINNRTHVSVTDYTLGLRKSVHTDKTSSSRHISDQEIQLKNNKYTQSYPFKNP